MAVVGPLYPPLIIAGGGGGAGGGGQGIQTSGGGGGLGGGDIYTGAKGDGGGGGGGYRGSGQAGALGAAGGISFLAGVHTSVPGGLGGVGGSYGGGGGGGYTGGTGGGNNGMPSQGGTSFDSGTNPIVYAGVNPGNGVVEIDVVCYLSGTLIAAPAGERPIEALAIGDLVLTSDGREVPIKWIGHRDLDTVNHPLPWKVWPVRVRKNAFGQDLPRRDLRLSPEHAVFVDEKLIPIGQLLNGGTIAQERVDHVSYWHVELESHDILLAEGLPAESYLDCGNRRGFDNCDDGIVALHPDWHGPSCGRSFASPSAVARARAALAARAVGQGRALEVEAYEAEQRARRRAARTNFVRNPRAEGCVPGILGAGGKAPLHWWLDAPDGIAIEIVGAGEEAGLPFLELRFLGRAKAAGNCCVHPEPGSASPARRGQYWTASCHIRLAGGGLDGVESVNLYFDETDADGAYLAGQSYPQSLPIADELALQRASATRVLSRPDVAATTAYVQISVAADTPIDMTLRLAGLQIEEGSYASELILPSPGEPRAASRRSADAPTPATSVAA